MDTLKKYREESMRLRLVKVLGIGGSIDSSLFATNPDNGFPILFNKNRPNFFSI